MSRRRAARARGRAYQPYPLRRSNLTLRVVVVLVGMSLLLGIVALAISR